MQFWFPAILILCQPSSLLGKTFPVSILAESCRKQPKENEKNRPANTSLSDLSNWTRSYIRDEELERFQLPDKVPTKKKPAIKPDYW